MVSVNDEKLFVVVDRSQEELNALREERKRTGRLVASGTAIFIFILGVYQALVGETPQYAALFLPAIIMFTYVGWILYASKRQRNLLLSMAPPSEGEELQDVVSDSQSVTKSNTNLVQVRPQSSPLVQPENNRKEEKRKEFQPRTHKTFHRTYSIA